jgi:hypothetical protein
VSRYYIIFIMFATLLFADSPQIDIAPSAMPVAHENDSNTTVSYPKIIYISYKKTPDRIISGQIFPVSIKYLITNPAFDLLTYTISNNNDMKLITPQPLHTREGAYSIDTFYFLDVNGSKALPKITATAVNSENNNTYPTSAVLPSQQLDVITLNPPANFSHIIAKDLNITDYKTTTYDNQYNMILFSAQASQSDLSAIHITGPLKQGIESLSNDYNSSSVVYYAIVNKEMQNFTFTYFNLTTQSYSSVSIPIIVVNDTVSTQSDLSPTNQQHTTVKLIVASVILFLLFIIIIFRKKYIYMFVALIPIIYIVYLLIPAQIVCIKQGSDIQILPIPQGVVFEHTNKILNLEKLVEKQGYTKIKLQNNKVGWVSNENICSN